MTKSNEEQEQRERHHKARVERIKSSAPRVLENIEKEWRLAFPLACARLPTLLDQCLESMQALVVEQPERFYEMNYSYTDLLLGMEEKFRRIESYKIGGPGGPYPDLKYAGKGEL